MRVLGKVKAVLGMLSIGHQTGWTGIIARMMHLFGEPKTGKCPRNWQGACAETTGDVQSLQVGQEENSEARNAKFEAGLIRVWCFDFFPFHVFFGLYSDFELFGFPRRERSGHGCGGERSSRKTANEYVKALRTEAGHVAAFLVWSVIGFAGAVIGG
jgi:hypothetical protein